MMAAGLLLGLLSGGVTGLGASFLGLLAGAGLLLPVYLLRGMGAGDVKLLAGIGAVLGPGELLRTFVAIALIGGVMGLVALALRGRAFATLRPMLEGWWLTLVTRRNHTVGAPEKPDDPTFSKLPYAVPIAIGTMLVQGLRLAGVALP